MVHIALLVLMPADPSFSIRVRERRYVRGLMTDAGLRVRSDGMGNIFGRWEGTHPVERACPPRRMRASRLPFTVP